MGKGADWGLGMRDIQWEIMDETTSLELEGRRLANDSYGHRKGGEKRGLTVNQKRVPLLPVRCIFKSKINRKFSENGHCRFIKGC